MITGLPRWRWIAIVTALLMTVYSTALAASAGGEPPRDSFGNVICTMHVDPGSSDEGSGRPWCCLAAKLAHWDGAAPVPEWIVLARDLRTLGALPRIDHAPAPVDPTWLPRRPRGPPRHF